MADTDDKHDKTEDPTQRRLEQAIERGDTVKSVEINTWFVLAGGTLALTMMSSDSVMRLLGEMRRMLAHAHLVPVDGRGLGVFSWYVGSVILGVVGLPLVVIGLAALAGGLVQHRPLFTTEPLAPKLDRLSPMAGLKRVFGPEAFVQFIKGLMKLAIVGVAMVVVIWPDRSKLEPLLSMDVAALPAVAGQEVLKLLGAVLAIYTILAIADFAYQKFSWYKRQMMTKREIKDEHKETEGSPEIKARIRQLRMQASRRRMMAQVPKASVVIMNPTHFAVALKYERGMPAPIVVAKGLDLIALTIRAVAEENRVPVVENPPLARALYKAVDLDQEIPVEHYKAVAEVIGFVMRLRRTAA